TVVKERIYLDKANRGTLHDEITTIDNALTRPWTVIKKYRRAENAIWSENDCTEGNQHVAIGKESYFLSADGLLMPTKKNQPPPDLKYFNQAPKGRSHAGRAAVGALIVRAFQCAVGMQDDGAGVPHEVRIGLGQHVHVVAGRQQAIDQALREPQLEPQ